jgi:hypothetical protein
MFSAHKKHNFFFFLHKPTFNFVYLSSQWDIKHPHKSTKYTHGLYTIQVHTWKSTKNSALTALIWIKEFALKFCLFATQFWPGWQGVCGALCLRSLFCARAPNSKKIRTPPAALAESSKVSLALLTFVRKYVLCTLLRVVPHFIDHTYTFYVACALRQVRARRGAHEYMCLSLAYIHHTQWYFLRHISLVFANLRGHHSWTALLQNLEDWLSS